MGLMRYQIERQNNDGRVPIIALMSLENRFTPGRENDAQRSSCSGWRLTVEPRDGDALDEDNEEHGWSDGYFVHEIDNVIPAVGTRRQSAQIADDQYAEHEQRAMASEEIGKFIA